MQDQFSEEWRPVAEFPGYSVSNLGRIRSEARTWRGQSHNGIIIKTGLSKGYAGCSFSVAGKVVRRSIHRLVATAFIGEIPASFDVNHKNGIRNDNRVENLEIVTRSQNLKHKFRVLGYSQHGARNPFAKLTDEDVKKIRTLLSQGELTQQQIAKAFDVSNTTIGNIKVGRIWSGKPRRIGPTRFRLKDDDVYKIRALAASGTVTYRAIGKQFGISAAAVCSIEKGRNWGHLR